MSSRAVVAGLDGRAAPFPIYVTAGDALPFTIEFILEDGSPAELEGTYVLEVRAVPGGPIVGSVLELEATGNELAGEIPAAATLALLGRPHVHVIRDSTPSSRSSPAPSRRSLEARPASPLEARRMSSPAPVARPARWVRRVPPAPAERPARRVPPAPRAAPDRPAPPAPPAPPDPSALEEQQVTPDRPAPRVRKAPPARPERQALPAPQGRRDPPAHQG